MISQSDHLILKLAEECSEVTQRAMKLLQFGPDEVQPGQLHSNKFRLEKELRPPGRALALLGICYFRRPFGWQ